MTSGEDVAAFAIAIGKESCLLHATQAGLEIADASGKVVGTTQRQQPVSLDCVSSTQPVQLTLMGRDATWEFAVAPNRRSFLHVAAHHHVAPGNLRLEVDQSDARVLLDDRVQTLRIRAGEIRDLRVAPGTHTLVVTKEWFLPATHHWRAQSGRSARFQARLIPATLVELRDAPADARVVVNGDDLGAVGKDGAFRSRLFAAGTCRIELKREKYAHQPLVRDCRHGETLVVSGADVQLTPTYGYVDIRTVPSNAVVTAQKKDSASATTLSQGRTELAAGQYTIRISAPGFQDKVYYNVEIPPGRANLMGDVKLQR
jgi:hypothetical protein